MLEAKTETPKEEMTEVALYGFMPPIKKLDASLSTLKKCKKLSLSTNQIDKITSVSGMDSLEIMSIGRNGIKKIEGLDGVADTLKELWISYNSIEKLSVDGKALRSEAPEARYHPLVKQLKTAQRTNI